MTTRYCLLVSLWFCFHIELAKCMLNAFRFSNFTPKCAQQKHLLQHNAIEVVHPTQV